jgi:hypothetical protein
MGHAASFPLFHPSTPKLAASATKRKATTMTSYWDEFSKSLAEESLPRRNGAALAGGVVPFVRLDRFAFVRFGFEAFPRVERVEAFFFFGTGGLLSDGHAGGAMTARSA